MCIRDRYSEEASMDYDRLAEECARILDTNYSDDLDELFRLGGSSGGARPKILTKIDGEEWIVKFPASIDRKDIGLIEYKYSCLLYTSKQMIPHPLWLRLPISANITKVNWYINGSIFPFRIRNCLRC